MQSDASNSEVITKIKEQIANNPIILYMKGNPQFPQCGFSAQVVQVLKVLGVTNYATINVLENPDIRRELPLYADWPTFPQLYVKGELIGGCDIVVELYQSGQLKEILATAAE